MVYWDRADQKVMAGTQTKGKKSSPSSISSLVPQSPSLSVSVKMLMRTYCTFFSFPGMGSIQQMTDLSLPNRIMDQMTSLNILTWMQSQQIYEKQVRHISESVFRCPFSLAQSPSFFFLRASLSPLSNLNSLTVILSLSLALSINSATGVAYLFSFLFLGSWSQCSWWSSSSLALNRLMVLCYDGCTRE